MNLFFVAWFQENQYSHRVTAVLTPPVDCPQASLPWIMEILMQPGEKMVCKTPEGHVYNTFFIKAPPLSVTSIDCLK